MDIDDIIGVLNPASDARSAVEAGGFKPHDNRFPKICASVTGADPFIKLNQAKID